MYVISDTHGNIEGLMKAMIKAKILDNHGQRQTSDVVVSIGDLINAVKDSVEGDIECLKLLGNEIDALIVGNHEIPYFDRQNRFSGFHYDPEIEQLLKSSNVIPAYCHHKTLITHAGLSEKFSMPYFNGMKPHLIADNLDERWEAGNFSDPVFSSCGKARWGDADIGGIVWCDFEDEFRCKDFPQVVGHTPRGVRMKGNSICIDVGAKDRNTEPFILHLI